MQLSTFKTGWKKLDEMLNKIVEAINANCPQRSDTIFIDETASGAIIKIAPPTDNGTAPGSGTSSTTSTDDDTALQNEISALQTDNSLLTARVAILETLLNGLTTQQLVVVDPNNNCAQSTVTFFIQKTPGT
jgi:hypothetical protein